MSSSNRNENTSRKILIFGLAIAAFSLLYTGAWFVGTSKAQTWLQQQLSSNRLAGMSIACNGMDIKGFPFRIGVFCDSASANRTSPAARISLGALRSAAQIYAPGHAIFEIDGPAVVQPAPGITATLDWDLFHGSIVGGLDGIDRSSIETNMARMEGDIPGIAQNATIALDHAEFHMRRNNGDLDIAFISKGTDIGASMTDQKLPAFSLSADLTLADYAPFLAGREVTTSGSTQGQLRQLRVDFGDQGALTLSGPFSISADGLLSGDFDLQAEQITTLGALLIGSFPEATQAIEVSQQLLQSLSTNGASARVRLTMQDGVILLGFIPIGFIPPI